MQYLGINQHRFELSWKVFKKLSTESWKVWAGTFFYPDLKVRPWKELLPSIAMVDNAYRPRKDEDDEKMPHSFLFRRRDCALDWYKPAVTYRQWINVKSFPTHVWEESPPTYQSDVYYFVGSSLTTWTLTWTKVCRAMCRRKKRLPRRYTARDNDIFALINISFAMTTFHNQPGWYGLGTWRRKCSRSGVVLALMLVIEQCCPMRGLMLWNHWRKLWEIIRSMVAQSDFTEVWRMENCQK